MSAGEVNKSRVFDILYYTMGIGLFVQLVGNVLYSSGSMNGVHIYLLLILPALFLAVLASVKKNRFFSSEARLFLLMAGGFLLFSSLSAAWSDGDDTVLYVLRKSAVIFLYLIGVIYLASNASIQHIKWFLIIVCVIAALGALISMVYQLTILGEVFGWRTFRISSMGYGKWIDLGYPVIAGIYFGFFAVMAASVIAIHGKDLSGNTILAVSILCLLPYMFLTFSRTSWIAGIVSVGYLLLVFRHRASILMACCLGGGLLIMAAFYYDNLLEEVMTRQLSGRPQIWLWTINMIFDSPYWGHGFDHSFKVEWESVPHAHNFYLQILFEQGIAGLAWFLAMLSALIHAVWKNRKNRWVVGLFSLVIYILTVMAVEIQHVITRPGLYWTVFWFPLALLVGLVNRDVSLRLAAGRQKNSD